MTLKLIRPGTAGSIARVVDFPIPNKRVSSAPVNTRYHAAVRNFCERSGRPSWLCVELIESLEKGTRHER